MRQILIQLSTELSMLRQRLKEFEGHRSRPQTSALADPRVGRGFRVAPAEALVHTLLELQHRHSWS